MKNLLCIRQDVVCLAFVALAACASHGQSLATKLLTNALPINDTAALRYRTGVRTVPGERQLDARQRQQVLQGLRAKTGWPTLDFDEAGFLVCPTPHVINGGSAAARRLLNAALFGKAVYELESHRNSLLVSFARLTTGVVYESTHTGERVNGWQVQLDFADFQQLRGDAPAYHAFDLGIALLHELAHGVWNLRDATSDEEEPGECETFINQIRRELHLPERQSYRAKVRTRRFNLRTGTRLIAELRFVSKVETQGRTQQKRYLLQWEAETVGLLSSVTRTAKVALTEALR